MATKRIANQVHKQASRLLREGYIQREPAWFRAVLDNPPLPLPARSPPLRTHFDTPSAATPLTPHADSKTTKPLPIKYVEDEIRRQFFRDHPFEAFRHTSLVEGAAVETEHPIRGVEWKRLRQRGRNPSPEDAVRYAVNLYEHHEMDLSSAYASAIAQFRSLRSELQVARSVALAEAEHLGMEFGPSQVDITFAKEQKALRTFRDRTAQDHTAETERKRWKAVVEREGRPDEWTKGQQYTRLWKEGVRPVYAPVFSEPAIKPEGLFTPERVAQRVSAQADFMNQLQHSVPA
ncbi:hypothetical protein V8D89_015592 [Ganoderma adspersum]